MYSKSPIYNPVNGNSGALPRRKAKRKPAPVTIYKPVDVTLNNSPMGEKALMPIAQIKAPRLARVAAEDKRFFRSLMAR